MSRHRRQHLRRQRRQAAGHTLTNDPFDWCIWCEMSHAAALLTWSGSCSACGVRVRAVAAAVMVARRLRGCA